MAHSYLCFNYMYHYVLQYLSYIHFDSAIRICLTIFFSFASFNLQPSHLSLSSSNYSIISEYYMTLLSDCLNQ